MHGLDTKCCGATMTSVFTIHELPEDVPTALRERAAAAGRSVEAEAREIIVAACTSRRSRDWWDGLAKRRDVRTPKRMEVESAELIREGRNTR